MSKNNDGVALKLNIEDVLFRKIGSVCILDVIFGQMEVAQLLFICLDAIDEDDACCKYSETACMKLTMVGKKLICAMYRHVEFAIEIRKLSKYFNKHTVLTSIEVTKNYDAYFYIEMLNG